MKKCALIFIAIGLLTGGPVQAALFEFDNITNNNAGDAGSDQVLFTFLNSGPTASSITKVHFDDDATVLGASGIKSIQESPPSVDFSKGRNPGNWQEEVTLRLNLAPLSSRS
jgi:hypothetical protein